MHLKWYFSKRKHISVFWMAIYCTEVIMTFFFRAVFTVTSVLGFHLVRRMPASSQESSTLDLAAEYHFQRCSLMLARAWETWCAPFLFFWLSPQPSAGARLRLSYWISVLTKRLQSDRISYASHLTIPALTLPGLLKVFPETKSQASQS